MCVYVRERGTDILNHDHDPPPKEKSEEKEKNRYNKCIIISHVLYSGSSSTSRNKDGIWDSGLMICIMPWVMANS